MPRYFIVNKATMAIHIDYESDAIIAFNSEFDDPDLFIHIPSNIPSHYDFTILKAVKDHDGVYSITMDTPLCDEYVARRASQAWDALRRERNRLLQETDWITLPDVNLTDEKKQAYFLYRQQLRDFTETVQDIYNPTYPTLNT